MLPDAYQLFHKSNQTTHGGAELNLYYLSKMFAQQNRYKVSFLVGDHEQKHAEIYDKVRVIKIRGLRFGKSKETKSKFIKLWRKVLIELSMAYEMLTRRYDIVVTSTASGLLSRAVFWGQVLGRKKVVFRLANDTDADPHYFEQAFGQKMKDRVYWWGVKKASVLIFQTIQQKEIFHQFCSREGRIIRNGFFLEPKGETGEKEFILWVSRAEEIKRPQLFLELAQKFPDKKFVMIMPGKTETSTRIQSRINETSNIIYISYVPFEEIQYYFNHAYLFVNTSTYEGFPNTFIQCGIGKTPILSFGINPDNIINQHQLGCVCDNSMEKAVHFIDTLTKEQIEQLGQNIWSYVNEYHDIHNTYHKYESLIRELCNKGG
jgi:glycosyltransferase involved in cell wall biosynthesis